MTNKPKEGKIKHDKFLICNNCGELQWGLINNLCDKCRKLCKEAEEYIAKDASIN